METTEVMAARLEMEEKSIPNQFAVIGVLKLKSVERYLIDNGHGWDGDATKIVYDAMRETWRDVHHTVLQALWDYAVHPTNWK